MWCTTLARLLFSQEVCVCMAPTKLVPLCHLPVPFDAGCTHMRKVSLENLSLSFGSIPFTLCRPQDQPSITIRRQMENLSLSWENLLFISVVNTLLPRERHLFMSLYLFISLYPFGLFNSVKSDKQLVLSKCCRGYYCCIKVSPCSLYCWMHLKINPQFRLIWKWVTDLCHQSNKKRAIMHVIYVIMDQKQKSLKVPIPIMCFTCLRKSENIIMFIKITINKLSPWAWYICQHLHHYSIFCCLCASPTYKSILSNISKVI